MCAWVLPRFGEIRAKMDHLVCFVPAMLALGVHAHAVPDAKAAKYLDLAEELGRTCWQMYAKMPSGAQALQLQKPSTWQWPAPLSLPACRQCHVATLPACWHRPAMKSSSHSVPDQH